MEDAVLDGNYQGVSYGLYDVINNDYDFEDMEKQSHNMSLKRRMSMNKISHKGEKSRVKNSPIIYILMLGTGARRSTLTGYFKIMR